LPIRDEAPFDFRFGDFRFGDLRVDDVRGVCGASNVSAEKSMLKGWPHIFGDSCELFCL